MPLTTSDLPALNAVLNSCSVICLISGYISIRQGNELRHQKLMKSALGFSMAFLVSYLTYHSLHGSTKFAGEGIARSVYLAILLTHTILAAGMVPLIIITVLAALRGHKEKHRRWAKFTFPIWTYVSITGVVIYLMLYQIYGGIPAGSH